MAYTTLTNGTLPDADEVMGNFDLVQDYIKSDIDTSGADHTETSATPQLKRTFALTGLATGDYIKSIWIECNLKETGGVDNAVVSMGLDDGTDSWMGGVREVSLIYAILKVEADVTGKLTVAETTSASYLKFRRGFIFPYNEVTGSTSYNIKVYLSHENGSDTATLEKGFTIRVVIGRRLDNSYGSMSDS